jgi:hypothetical protein
LQRRVVPEGEAPPWGLRNRRRFREDASFKPQMDPDKRRWETNAAINFTNVPVNLRLN